LRETYPSVEPAFAEAPGSPLRVHVRQGPHRVARRAHPRAGDVSRRGERTLPRQCRPSTPPPMPSAPTPKRTKTVDARVAPLRGVPTQEAGRRGGRGSRARLRSPRRRWAPDRKGRLPTRSPIVADQGAFVHVMRGPQRGLVRMPMRLGRGRGWGGQAGRRWSQAMRSRLY